MDPLGWGQERTQEGGGARSRRRGVKSTLKRGRGSKARSRVGGVRSALPTPGVRSVQINFQLFVYIIHLEPIFVVEGFSPRLSLLLDIPRVLAQAFQALFWGLGPGQWPRPPGGGGGGSGLGPLGPEPPPPWPRPPGGRPPSDPGPLGTGGE